MPRKTRKTSMYTPDEYTRLLAAAARERGRAVAEATARGNFAHFPNPPNPPVYY